MELSPRLQEILLKLERVQAKMARLEADNAALREEQQVLNEKLQQLKAAAAKDKLKVAGGVQGKEESGRRAFTEQDIRQQIDRYISEIDKCIEWLNAQ